MQFQVAKKYNYKNINQLLIEENKFITNLLSLAALPERGNLDEDNSDLKPTKHPNTLNDLNKKPRAKSLQELEDRLKAITVKKRLSYKEKLAKKGLKNRLKRKNKQDERNVKIKLGRAAKLTLKQENGSNLSATNAEQSPNSESNKGKMFNSEDKLVFSKFDFSNLGKQKMKKQEKDPKKILQKLNEDKTKLQKLEESGDIQKVIEMKEKSAWKNALAKAQGQKIKDDPVLLQKSVKKKEQKVRSSKKKWESRIKGVEKAKEEKQKKRKENIDKRKKEKKVKKLKTAAKKGKIIPGF